LHVAAVVGDLLDGGGDRDRAMACPVRRAQLELLGGVRVIVCLGAFAWDAALRLVAPAARPRPRFGHGAEHHPPAPHPALLGCFHPSQQNTFTGKLTPAMIDAVLLRAAALATAGGEEGEVFPPGRD
jgi:uracil-DNA glycosylase